MRRFVVSSILGLASCRDRAPTTEPEPTICLATEAHPASRDELVCGVVDRIGVDLDLDSARARTTLSMRPAAATEECDPIRSVPALGSVRWNDLPATATRASNGAWDVCGPKTDGAIVVGADVALAADESATNGIGLTHPLDRFDHEFTYLLGWIESCDLFGPCVVESSRLAWFDFEIAHDASTTVLCPGTRVASANTTRCVLDGTRAPTYSSFGILASDAWVRSEWTEAAGLRVERYEVSEGTAGATIDPGVLADYLEWITDLLGPFPYGDSLRVAFAPTHWLGFEHPANIVLSDTVDAATSVYSNPARHTLFHEIAHQWAGNRTTLAHPYEFVWKEALAEYLAYVYEDEHFPSSSITTRTNWDSIARFATVYPRPLDEPPPPFAQVTFSSYGTGPMLLLALEDRLGRAVVLEAIGRFLAEPSARSVAEWIAIVESTAGVSLDLFASTYVFGTGEVDWPAFEVVTTEDSGTVTLTVTQHVLGGPPRPAIVTVRLVGATGSADVRIDFGDAPDSPTTIVQVAFAEPVIDVVVDPDHRALDAPHLDRLAPGVPTTPRPLHP